jgi:hypothetical protein
MAVAVCVLMIALSLLPAGLAYWGGRRVRAALRHCPCCRSEAVRETLRRPLTLSSARITLQCGQCGAWRRIVAPSTTFRGFERRVRRSRRRIAADARRLDTQRRRDELTAFRRALRSEIKGADDFLARTRSPRTTA